MKRIVKILSLFLVVGCIFCSCKKADKAESDVVSEHTDSVVSESSSEVISSDSESSVPVDTTVDDPQPAVKDTESGATVKAEELEVREGKANGIDVSKWQGKIDWKKVENSGVDFAIIRIGYRAENGSIYKDECADYNIQQAVKNNILVGVYFFSSAVSVNEAKEEANWTAQAVKCYPISYPVVYDCEGYLNADSRMYSLTNAQRTSNALAFLSEIEKSGYDGMFYAAANEMKGSLRWDMSRIENSYKVWVAHYPSVTYPEAQTPQYSGKYDMWQYTNRGSVNGIKGETDMVVSYFVASKANPKSTDTAPVASALKENDGIYTEVNDTVTAKDVVNLRESASTSGEIVGTLKNGETLNRTATGANGWSKLILNGKTVYAVTSYLTTDLNFKTPTPEPDDGFTAVNEQVTAKSETNLRSVPNTSDTSTVVYTLKNGEVAVRTGVSSGGWSKLTWNGQTVYAITSYLTTDLNYKAPTESGAESETGIKTQFSDVNEQVTAKSETNLRTLPSVTDSEIVYTLKNGEYLTRTGVSSNGWSRIIYNGQTVYAVSSYLTK